MINIEYMGEIVKLNPCILPAGVSNGVGPLQILLQDLPDPLLPPTHPRRKSPVHTHEVSESGLPIRKLIQGADQRSHKEWYMKWGQAILPELISNWVSLA